MSLDALSQTRGELIAALDAIVSERELTNELRSAVSALTAERDELGASCVESRRAAIDADARAADERRAADEQLRALRIALAERDAALVRASSASAPMRDLEQLRQSIRDELEAPTKIRIAALESELIKTRTERVEAERMRDVGAATTAAAAAQALRESEAVAEAHTAACASLNARIIALEISIDESSAESSSALRRARDEATRATARARSLNEEAATLREERDSARGEGSRALTSSARELSSVRDSLRVMDSVRAAAERQSDGSAAEAAALRETVISTTQRVGELTAELIRAESSLRMREASDENNKQMIATISADSRAESTRNAAFMLERVARAELQARIAEEALQKERQDSEERAALDATRIAAAEEATRAVAGRARTALARETAATRLLIIERRTFRRRIDAPITSSLHMGTPAESADGASFAPQSFKGLNTQSSSRASSPAPQMMWSAGNKATLASPLSVGRRGGIPPLPAPTPVSAAAAAAYVNNNNASGDNNDQQSEQDGDEDGSDGGGGGGVFFEGDGDAFGLYPAEDEDEILGPANTAIAKLRDTLAIREGEVSGLRHAISSLRMDALRANATLADVNGIITDSLRAQSEAEKRATLAEGRLGAAEAAAYEALGRAAKAEAATSAFADRMTLESGSALRAAHDARATVLAALDDERAAAENGMASAMARTERTLEAHKALARKAASYKSKLLALFAAFGKIKTALSERDAQLAQTEADLARAMRARREGI